jgi:hypothetical protein
MPPRHSSKKKFTASSTAVSPDDLGTWTVDGNDLVEVAHKALATLNGLCRIKVRAKSEASNSLVAMKAIYDASLWGPA